MSLTDIESLLKGLRTPSDGRILFNDYLSDAWEIFQFDGKPDLASFEGFLIEVIFQVFDKAEHNRDKAKSRDACLVGLGLLEKCYHTKTNSSVPAHCDIATRCVSYLSGDYIKLSYPVPEEGANYNITDSRSLPRQALDQSARRARKQLSKRLTYMAACGKESCQKCLQAGKKNHTELITLPDGENERTIRRVILPPPCYTLKNFPIQDQQPTSAIREDAPPEETDEHAVSGEEALQNGSTQLRPQAETNPQTSQSLAPERGAEPGGQDSRTGAKKRHSNGTNKLKQILHYLWNLIRKFFTALNNGPKVSNVWVIILRFLWFLLCFCLLFRLKDCSVSRIHYVDRINGIEFSQMFFSPNPLPAEIKVTDLPVDTKPAPYPVPDPFD